MQNNRIEVSAALIPTCLQTGAKLGVPQSAMAFYVNQLNLDQLDSTKISYKHILELLDIIRDRSKRNDIGLLVGEEFGFSYNPPVVTFLRTLGSLRDLVREVELVKCFFSPDITINISENGYKTTLDIPIEDEWFQQLEERALVFAAEGILAFIKKLLVELLGEDYEVFEFFFHYEKPEHFMDYQRCFNTSLRFGCQRTGFVIPSRLLDVSLKGALPALHHKAKQRMEEVLKRSDFERDSRRISDIIISAFKQDIELIFKPLSATADYFHVSERTLQRKLKRESITFFDLQEKEKQHIAIALIKDRYDLETIAEKLKFSDRRSFSRAFRRWFGYTPKEYRALLTET